MDFISLKQAVVTQRKPTQASLACHKPRSTQKQKGVSLSTASYYVPIFTKGQTTKNTARQIVWGFGGYYFCLTGQVSWAIRNMY